MGSRFITCDLWRGSRVSGVFDKCDRSGFEQVARSGLPRVPLVSFPRPGTGRWNKEDGGLVSGYDQEGLHRDVPYRTGRRTLDIHCSRGKFPSTETPTVKGFGIIPF